MWAPGARAQGLQPREELGEEVGAPQGMPSRFTTTWASGSLSRSRISPMRRAHPAADGDDVIQCAVVALGIDDAELVVAVGQSLDEPGREGGLACARRSRDENVAGVGCEGDRGAVVVHGQPTRSPVPPGVRADRSVVISSSISSATPLPLDRACRSRPSL
jgi:hypothetical protein